MLIVAYQLQVPSRLEREMKKWAKRNKGSAGALESRLTRICDQPTVEGHTFKYDFAGCREVHFEKSFVLVWKVNEATQCVVLVAFAHKDDYREATRRGVVAARAEGMLP